MKTLNLSSLFECAEKRSRRNFEFCPDYAEPGYSSEKGIVFGNWNPACGFDKTKAEQKRDAVSKLARVLEGAGFDLGWEDEWTTCGDCGKAVRTSGDSYGWTPHYRILNERELICLDCLDVGEYLESIEDDATKCCAPSHNPEDYGYSKYNGDFETGFHPGQNDRPNDILAKLHAAGKTQVVFKLASVGQFDARWQAYFKPSE